MEKANFMTSVLRNNEKPDFRLRYFRQKLNTQIEDDLYDDDDDGGGDTELEGCLPYQN